MDWGTIKKVEIGDGKETEGKKYIVEANFEDDQDGRDIQIINLSGLNIRPRVGHKLLVLNLGGFEIGICTDDNIDCDLADGEMEIYSINSNNEKSAKIKMRPDGSIYLNEETDFGKIELDKDGNVIINEGTDNSVRYSKLKEEFDKLKQDLNNFITSVYNAHTHPYVDSPVGASNTSATLTLGTASTADISSSKIDEIKVP